jgi:hypothetical protein
MGSMCNLKVIYVDLVTLTFIFHFLSHMWRIRRYSWRMQEALRTSLWLVSMTVSSANVPIVTLSACGRSDVNRRYSRGPNTLGGKSAVKRGYGNKGSWVKHWACLGCWNSPCYGRFSLGALFENYKLFISSIFNFFKMRLTADNWKRSSWISEYGGTTVLNTLRTGNFLQKIFHTSLIRCEVAFTIRRKAPSIV